MTHVRYEGEPLTSRDRVEWVVTLWDEDDAEGPQAGSWFELGLLDDSDWTAHWITGDYTPRRNQRRPVDHFRTTFTSDRTVQTARLYVTARGLYQAHINDHRVGQFRLAPGSTDYRHRLQYQTYDVADLLETDNTLELQLADGWYRGSIGCFGPTNVFGRQTSLLAQVEITYTDGTHATIGTGDRFSWSDDGPWRRRPR